MLPPPSRSNAVANRIPRITKRSVDAVKTGGTDTVYWDGELTGFGLRVRRSGRKSYVVQTRIAGKLCWFPGSHLTDLQRPWRRIRKREGLEDVRIHDLRHSFASRALALGESLTMIGKLLGHTQVQTTARYAHLARDSIQTFPPGETVLVSRDRDRDAIPQSS